MSFWDFFKPDYYRRMTDAVNDWWSSIFKPSSFYDKIELVLTIHICGSEDVIEKKASEITGKTIDYPGTAGLALYDSSGKPHIFILSTEIGFVQQEINYFTAGHELAHIIDMHNERQGERSVDYPNPDEGRK
jgi:hypothetical protein